MNPRAEAQARAGEAYDARVLEPSPPAAGQQPWFADDPVARDGATRPVLSPVSSGDVLWAQLCAGDDNLEAWCRARWLGPYPALRAVPGGYAQTRTALHAVAEHVLKPAREQANGKIGLRFVRGGFGTPYFGDDVQVSVTGALLHVVRGGERASTSLTSLAAAADALGDLLEPPPQLSGSALVIDEAAGARAAYGCSPGDEQHPEPYLYVAPWTARPTGELWQAAGFAGAELAYAELLEAADPRALALSFFEARLAALAG